MCQSRRNNTSVQCGYVRYINFSSNYFIAQLDALIASLCIIRDKDPSVKSLVVSQFTSFLDLIEAALEKESFPFVRLDGRMMQEARVQAMKNFSDPSSSSPKVFLLSLSAGGVGLNLTAATRVFLMDPVSVIFLGYFVSDIHQITWTVD